MNIEFKKTKLTWWDGVVSATIVIFIVFKLCGILTWSWLIVLIPVWYVIAQWCFVVLLLALAVHLNE